MAGGYSAETQVFNPKMVPSLVLWLDGQDPSANGVVPSNATQIATWVDKSNIGNNATQGTAGQRPTYSTGALVNGVTRNALQFTRASSQHMQLTTTSFPTGSGARTEFIVFTTADNLAYEPLLALGTLAGNEIWVMVSGGTSQFTVDGDGSNAVATTTSVVNNTTYLFETNYAAGANISATTIFINGVSQAITSAPGVMNTVYGGAFLGSQSNGTSPYLSGLIGEVIMYNSALSVANQTLVRTYLRNKYGV